MMAMPSVRLPPRLVTHIVQDEPLIKVFTTHDVVGLHTIERTLGAAIHDIQQSNVRAPSDVAIGSTVLVPHMNKYRRAEVVAAEAGGRTMVVKLLDIGGSTSCSIYEVKVIPAELKPKLLTIPIPQTDEYILHYSLTDKTWNLKELETVNVLTSFTEESLQLHVVGSFSSCSLLRINYKNEGTFAPFTMWLSDNGLSSVVSADQVQAVISRKYPPRAQYPPSVPPGFQPIHHQHQHIIPTTLPFAHPQQPIPQRPILPTPMAGNFQLYGTRPTMTAALPSPRLRGPRPPPFTQPAEPVKEQAPQIFISETLPVGSVHDVFVSYVIDGAQNFTVQLVTKVKDVLTPLMVVINDTPAEPLTDPLQPGTICLGRYMNDNALCRAVVSTVLADGANLYFVDFGNSDIVPFNEIYKLQPKFLKEKMVAIRFSLAGISDDYLLTTKEAIKVFEQLTVESGYPIKMEVVKPETPLKQFCKLFIEIDGKMVNVKDKMKDKMRVLHAVDYKTIPFKKGSQADVVISYFESPLRFFVQMTLNAPQLATIMKAIENYCLNADDKEILFAEDLNLNVPVCAKFSDDGLWYRAQVISDADEKGNVDVLFVDYGNTEKLHYSNLRIMTNEMISLGPVQAVECRLDFDADLSVREDVIACFTEMASGRELAMHVVNVLPAKTLLVDLIDKTNNVVLKDVLKERFSSPPQTKANVRSPAPASSQNAANWRDRPNAANDKDFSAFKTRPTNPSAIDEPDNVRTDSFERRGDRFAQRDGAPPKRFERNEGSREQSDFWKKPRQEDNTTSWNDHDDRTTKKDDDGGPWNRNSEGGFRSRGRDNDRDGAAGGRSFGRDGGERSWKSNRDGDDRGGDRKPWRDDSAKSSGGDNWSSGKKDDSWSSENRRAGSDWSASKKDDGGWSSENRRGGGDRDFRSNDRGRDGDDRGGDRKPYPKRGDNWNTEKKEDSWSGGNRRDFKSNDDNRGGNRDSKPWGDRGGGSREKRDFGGGGSSWKSADTGSSWNAPKTPTREPAYERGAQFVEPEYQPGSTIEAVVTWFVNPMQFYVMPADDGKFRAMMETFQADYSKRETVELSSLSPNECIVARDKDDVIYRARFLRSRPGGALVIFADYGNTATIREAWAVSQEHCVIPIQAICCKLHNISRADENTPWSAIQNLDSYFEGDKYTVTLVECVEENGSKIWSVNLTNATTNADVGDVLVESGLAVRQNLLKSDELYDLAILKHQTLVVHPGNIVSSKEFFVHIDRNCAHMIQTKIAELSESKAMVPLSKESIVAGEFCLAPSEEEYFRALILSVDTATENAHLTFIDFGDETDVPFSSLNRLPDHLAVHPAQIAECSLYQGDSFENEDEFCEILGDDQIIKVMDIVDNKLQVILYNLEGVRLPYPTAVEESISPICPLPLLRFTERVSISHIEKNKVYLQPVAYETELAALVVDLHTFYEQLEASEEKPALEADKFYAAKSAKFEMWCRCKVADEECKEVFYFDYGNTELVDELLAIKLLDPKFHDNPMYCVGVSTNVNFTAEDVTPLLDIVQTLIFEATFKSVGLDEWYADLRCESTRCTFANYAVEAGCGEAIPSSEEEQKPHTAFASWELTEEKQVKVSHVDSPNKIFLQSVEDQPAVTSLMEELQSSLIHVLPLIGPHDELMAALNPADEKWYRVKPVSKDEVLAFDFGFTLKSPILKKLPKRFKDDESTFTVTCSLNLQPMDDAWSAEITARLADTVAKAESVVAKLEFVQHHIRFVDIKVDSNSISEAFTTDGIATYKANEVIVTHANSLNDFYLQYGVDADEVNALSERMLEAEAWEAITEEPEVGKIFAAQFVDDEQWYRATFVKNDEENKWVRFIDYGNEGVAVQLRALPHDLIAIPPYAVQCIQCPMPDNADELHDVFVQFSTSVEENLTAFVISGGVPMMVMLEYRGQSLSDVLMKKKCLLEWKLQPADVGEKVVVSHINSPASFYVRSETATLEEVENALASVESAEPLTEASVDDIVAAKFPEDDMWYRAKVIDTGDGKTTVLFVDYGNRSEVVDLRALPDDAKLTACAAKHCSFAVPDGQSAWPNEAINRFAEMTVSSDTVFTIAIKEDGDPALVDLLEDGMSVAEELATLSKADLTTPTPDASKEVVVLSHVESVHAVWIQYQSPQLDEMIEEMANAESFEDVEDAEAEALVAALFEEVWYRAKVIEAKSEENNARVLFIDYGNEAEATALKMLPEDLASLPALAKCCRLKEDVPAAAETSTLEKLQEYVADGQTFLVDELVESEVPAIVTLCCYDDGKRGKTLSEIILGPGGDEVNGTTADDAGIVESASDEVCDAVEAVEDAALTDETIPGEETEYAETEIEPQPSGEEQVIEALEGLKIENPISEETALEENSEKPIIEDVKLFEEVHVTEDVEHTTEDQIAFEEIVDEIVIAESLAAYDDNVEEEVDQAQAEESSELREHVEPENEETISAVTTNESAEDVIQKSPVITDQRPIEKEEEPATTDDKDAEAVTSPVKNDLNEAQFEDEADKFQTPSCKSSTDEFVTPEGVLDESSVTEELLDSSYIADETVSAETIIDAPEFAELFDCVATNDLDESECLISYVKDALDFYVQRTPQDVKCAGLVEKLLKACADCGALTEVENPEAGDIVAAKVDDIWYRVKVMSPCDVVCVDHGQPCPSKELFALPDKLCVLPAFAHHCALNLPKSPESVSQSFKEIVAGGKVLKIKCVEQTDEKKIVELRDGSSSVTHKLLEQVLSN